MFNVNATKVIAGVLLLSLLMVSFVGACAQPTAEPEPTGPVKVVIGGNMCITGPAAFCGHPEYLGFTDTIIEANRTNAIPGVQLEVAEYDNEYKAEKVALGYRFCRDKGAKIIWAITVQDIEGMLPMAQEDNIVLLNHQNSKAATDIPSWGFAMNLPTEYSAAKSVDSVVEWIWDYDKEGRVPNIASIAWDNAMGNATVKGSMAACARLGDKVNWVGQVLVPPGTVEYADSALLLDEWGADFVISGLISAVAVPIMKQISASNYDYKLFWQDPGISGWGLVVKARAAPEDMDGHYWLGSMSWPTLESEGFSIAVAQMKKMQTEEEIDKWKMLEGYEYGLARLQALAVIECVKTAAAAVGPENITGDDLYKAMQSIEVDGKGIMGPNTLTWTEAKHHTASDVARVYQIQAPACDPVPVSDWFEVEREM